ncbi:hypothetical protein FIBSPDRAFT_1040910 [Athelia psychrophila]|uniref:Uncharacterized protein n=1 Tax=Athelia psychrophila TaxID=1759441 RepID=A0A166PRH6_9AGAM|nr:hypothetical protein FIBSPDRAFT_1040910 [Fibularhizoctonia sp. CBS 109695]
MSYSSGPSTFFLPPQSMNFHDDNENASAGEPSTSALTASAPQYGLNLPPVTFTVHNAGGHSRITNVNGDHITTNINCVRCYCVARDEDGGGDGDGDEARRRCAHRTGASGEEGREALALALALALLLSLALALAKHRAEAQAEHDRDDKRSPQTPAAAAAAAVSIQFNLALGGPSCEGQIGKDESKNGGEAPTSVLTASVCVCRLNTHLAPVTFTAHNAGDGSTTTNVHGDHTTNITCVRAGGRRTEDGEENDHAASARHPTKRDDSTSPDRKQSSSTHATAAISIQLNIESQIVVSYRVMAMSTGVLFVFLFLMTG